MTDLQNILEHNCHQLTSQQEHEKIILQDRDKYLNMIYFNAVSIRNKLDEISLFIKSFNYTIQVIAISETRIRENEKAIFNINGYNAFHSTRNNKSRGGGCSLFIHSSLNSTLVKEKCENDQNYLVVKILNPNINIISTYRPPNTDIKKYINSLENILNLYQNSILIGDINLDLLNRESSNIQTYINSIQTSGFCILNKIDKHFATRVTDKTKTIIDHIITDLFNFKFKISLNDLSFSDHKFFLISLINIKNQNKNINHNIQKKILNYDQINIQELKHNLSTVENFETLIKKIQDKSIQNYIKIKNLKSEK